MGTSEAYMTMYGGTDEHCDRIWHWYGRVLTPPSCHHNGHVETQDERQRDEIIVRTTEFD